MKDIQLIPFFQGAQEAIISELKEDQELYNIAHQDGVNDAGEILPLRVHPDTEFIDLPAYWVKLKLEFKELVCKKSDKYSKVYYELNNAQHKIDTWFIPIITSAIAVHVGLEVAIITPFVRLLIIASARLGVEAYCREGIEDSLDNPDLKI